MLKHLIQISDLTRTEIEKLILLAESLQLTSPEPNESKNALAALLFFENSTRTRISFDLAAARAGIKTVNLDINTSSVKKEESIIDTIQTLGAMGVRYFVIRHPESGVFEKIIPILEGKDSALGEQFHFINAGDGQHAHPTQALLDMLTIYQMKNQQKERSQGFQGTQNFEIFGSLRVGILGDSLHSRVARSDMAALQILGCRDIRLIGPKEWLLPSEAIKSIDTKTGKNANTTVTHHQNEKALEDLDVIITLRVQKERIADFNNTNTNVNGLDVPVDAEDVLNHYIKHYQLTQKRLKLAKPDAIVMHPGPMNRGIEIASEVADGAQSAILKQVHNGVLMRTAVWESMDYN